MKSLINDRCFLWFVPCGYLPYLDVFFFSHRFENDGFAHQGAARMTTVSLYYGW